MTSKLWVSDANYEKGKVGVQNSLDKLDLGYIDLYLLHQSYGDIIGAWKALEEYYDKGLFKAIGVSNFYQDQYKNLVSISRVKPVVNQIEVNPFMQQVDDVPYFQSEGVVVEAWAPFSQGKNNIFDNLVINEIAQKYHKTGGQVLLRWLLQRNVVVIPKTSRLERM